MTLRRVLVVGLVATAAVATVRADVLTDLGVAASDAKEMTMQAITAGSLPWGAGRQKFRAASAQQRAAIVRNAMAWAKTLTGTQAFAAAYAQAREQMKPSPPAAAVGADQQIAKQLAEIDQTEANAKKQFANQPDLLKQVLAGVDMARAQLKAMATNQQYRQAIDAGNVQEKKNYEARLAKFDVEHPADVHAAIAIRLHQLLDACRDVDYSAKLKPVGGGRMVFADAQYEDKPSDWKLCYRVGKEPLDAAKAAAETWLKEMGK